MNNYLHLCTFRQPSNDDSEQKLSATTCFQSLELKNINHAYGDAMRKCSLAIRLIPLTLQLVALWLEDSPPLF